MVPVDANNPAATCEEPSHQISAAAAGRLGQVQQLLKGSSSTGGGACRCASHPRPHQHLACSVDLQVKAAALGGSLTIVKRDMAARKRQRGGKTAAGPSSEPLEAGTSFELVKVEPL